MVALFTKICSSLHKSVAHCLQHLYYTSKAKLLSVISISAVIFGNAIAERLWQMMTMMSLNSHKGVADP